ncbi:LysM peptidoglycan-binding domain-containing protein [uncultured Jatrophihabitans sp.]|uniref:LysM peptidoglycan-binding domain-containing protein n=1 Tax=uncultured Jatrophihabitans sp. TaxID=1610747 RepID=UPI0035CB8A12
MNRYSARSLVLAGSDAVALFALRPRWDFVATGLSRPATWLSTAGVDVALAAVCVLLLWLAAVWIAVGLIAGLGARLPGATGLVCRRLARVVVPRVLVRVVLGSTGLGLLAAPAAQAMPSPHAAPAAGVQTSMTGASTHHAAFSPWAGSAVPSPTWPVTPPASSSVAPPTSAPVAPPTWPTSNTPTSNLSTTPTPSTTPTRIPSPAPPSGPRTQPRSNPATPATSRTEARVHRGESLWLLAAHRLGASADAGDIAHYWPQIYAANRSVIGDDPSVIHPGQVLHLPTPTQESS